MVMYIPPELSSSAIRQAVDDLNEEQIENMIHDFIHEHELVGEFLVWVEKWKSLHKVQA